MIGVSAFAALIVGLANGKGAGYVFLAGLVLDVDGSVSSDALKDGLIQKYPFIDSDEAAESLVTKIKSKMPAHLKKGEGYSVSLSPEETASALEMSSLSDDQLQLIQNDLR